MKKLVTVAVVVLTCSAGLALAADNPSGRPGQILSKDQCQKAWNAAGPDGGTLSEAKATPYVSNFAQVDTSHDRQISKDEWTAGCNKGWVSVDARDAKTGADTRSSGDMSKNKSSQ